MNVIQQEKVKDRMKTRNMEREREMGWDTEEGGDDMIYNQK